MRGSAVLVMAAGLAWTRTTSALDARSMWQMPSLCRVTSHGTCQKGIRTECNKRGFYESDIVFTQQMPQQSVCRTVDQDL